MTGWTPLFHRIVGSSIWDAPDHVRIAWITLLATADRTGVCSVTVGGLARLARITREQSKEALDMLSSPDADSLTEDENQGRRIVRVENGWQILTWNKYRVMAKAAVDREMNAKYQADHRAKLKDEANSSDDPNSENTPEQTRNLEMARPVIAYLNEKTGKHFREIPSNANPIAARLKESGVTLAGVFKMLDRQVALWEGKSEMKEYLRPETLFGQKKFDGYYAAKDLPVTHENHSGTNRPLTGAEQRRKFAAKSTTDYTPKNYIDGPGPWDNESEVPK